MGYNNMQVGSNQKVLKGQIKNAGGYICQVETFYHIGQH